MKKSLLFLFIIFSNAFTPITARIVVGQISPVSFAFLRFGIAAVLLHIIFLSRRQSYKIDKKDITMFLWLGLLVIPINQLCFLFGVKFANASHSGAMTACTPLFAYIISIFIGTEKFNFRKLIIILASIIGLLAIFFDGLFINETKEVAFGDLLLVGAVSSWAAYLVFSNGLVIKYGALKTSTLAFTIGLIIYLPFFIGDAHNLTYSNLNGAGLISFLYLSLVVSFLTYFAFIYASKFFAVSTTTTILNSTPIVALTFSYLLLGESMSWIFFAGASIAIACSFLIQLYGKA